VGQEPQADDEPLTLREALVTAAAFVGVAGALIVLHQFVHFNWGWVPWKQLAVLGVGAAVCVRWIARGVRALVRRFRGLPPLEREPSKRDRLAEKVRELDEPYLRHERTTTIPD
jgi:hypothetical protein